MRTRFPANVYRHGQEPDPRFSLANERTFLAWVRTSLALLAAGVALRAIDISLPSQLRLATAMLFVALGLLAAIRSWVGWMRTERALREQRPLSGPGVGLVIAAGVAIAVLLLAVGILA